MFPDCYEQNVRRLMARLGFVFRFGRVEQLLELFTQQLRSFNYDLVTGPRRSIAATKAEPVVKVPHFRGHIGNRVHKLVSTAIGRRRGIFARLNLQSGMCFRFGLRQ